MRCSLNLSMRAAVGEVSEWMGENESIMFISFSIADLNGYGRAQLFSDDYVKFSAKI